MHGIMYKDYLNLARSGRGCKFRRTIVSHIAHSLQQAHVTSEAVYGWHNLPVLWIYHTGKS